MAEILYLESSRPLDEARERVQARLGGGMPRFWPLGGFLCLTRRLSGDATVRPDSVAVRAIFLGWLDIVRRRSPGRSLLLAGRLIATDTGSELIAEFHLPFWHWAANGALVGLLAGLIATVVVGDPLLLFPFCVVGALVLGAAAFGAGQVDAWLNWARYEASGAEIAATFRAALDPPPERRDEKARPEDGLAWTDSPVPPGATSWGADERR